MHNDPGMPNVYKSKDSPDDVKRQEEDRKIKQDLEYRMDQLREWYPEWFNYSDTLGERPIDGMMRDLKHHYELKELNREADLQKAYGAGRQVDINRSVAPEYTDEVQQGVPPGMVKPMGPIM